MSAFYCLHQARDHFISETGRRPSLVRVNRDQFEVLAKEAFELYDFAVSIQGELRIFGLLVRVGPGEGLAPPAAFGVRELGLTAESGGTQVGWVDRWL